LGQQQQPNISITFIDKTLARTKSRRVNWQQQAERKERAARNGKKVRTSQSAFASHPMNAKLG
jgi:hypothetical protein